MKIFLLITALVTSLLYSCTTPEQDSEQNYQNLIYDITTIDSCEYIVGSNDGPYNGGYFLTHKGDCKSLIHSRNKTVEIDTIEY